MRVNIISDLHLEFGDLELPGGDILVISGDVCESRTLTKYKYDPMNIMTETGNPKRMDRAQRFFHEECAKYREVIYVMGNHEHYHGRYDKTVHELKATVPDNVNVLENESIEIDGVLFLGGTLWTDCNKGDPLTLHALGDMMNDFRIIRNDELGFTKLRPAHTMHRHQRTVTYLKTVLADRKDNKVVVVGHHAPTLNSIHEKYRNDQLMNGGYASDLSELILDHPQIVLWCHGHMHDPFDYMVGETRVVCNPRGYAGHDSQADVFEVKYLDI
jgi:Icc-related predicted phosphoesterase